VPGYFMWTWHLTLPTYIITVFKAATCGCPLHLQPFT
jgi:hypothetical protein